MDDSLLLRDKKLGLLLATPPRHSNFRPAIALIDAALAEGVSVYLYCIDDGVACVGTPEIQRLKATANLHLFACAYGAHRRKIAIDDSAAFSGLTIVSDIVASTDRFLAFT